MGLDVQEATCRRWAKANGHRVAHEVREEGVSGAKELTDRPALARVLHMLKAGDVEGVLVYRLDRLARDLVLQEQLLAEVRRMGGQVLTTSAAEAGYLADDPDDPSRRLIRQVLGAVNEYERAMIALRLRSGRRAKAERGGFAYGSPALGWRAEGKTLIAVADEQETVNRIMEMHSNGTSLRTICESLNAEGRRTKRGARWHPQTVARVVARQEGAV